MDWETLANDAEAVVRGRAFFNKLLGKRAAPVVIVDIDGTLVHEPMRYDPASGEASEVPRLGVVELVCYMASRGAHVYILTARPITEHRRTIELLAALGLGSVRYPIYGVTLADVDFGCSDDVRLWKAKARAAIMRKYRRRFPDMAIGNNAYDVTSLPLDAKGPALVLAKHFMGIIVS